jgi:hypothetical protein
LTAGGGADGQILTIEDNTLDIARAANSEISEGATVYVTYRYADASFFSPVTVYDLDEVFRLFGEPYDPQSGQITSPLSLACQIAMRNGASEVVLQATSGASTSTSTAELAAAYAKLTTILDLDILVPLPVGISSTQQDPGDLLALAQALNTYLEKLNRDENVKRVAILGWEDDATINPDTLAAGVSGRRVMLAYPNRMNLYMPPVRQSIEVSGYYLAAAFAGRAAGLPIPSPLTNKQVYGFSGIPASVLQKMTRQQKNQWSEAGVAVVEQTKDLRLVIRHGVTTDTGSIYDRELSLVRSDDALDQLLTDTLNASALIGTWVTLDTPLQVKQIIVGALDRAVDASIVIAYDGVRSRQVSMDPSLIEVRFQYLPPFPLNYIVVRYAVNTDTGQISREV